MYERACACVRVYVCNVFIFSTRDAGTQVAAGVKKARRNIRISDTIVSDVVSSVADMSAVSLNYKLLQQAKVLWCSSYGKALEL